MTDLGGITGAIPVAAQGPVGAVERLEFWASGIPVPQGSKKAFVIGNRAVIVDAHKGLKPWRATVRDAAETALAGQARFNGAVLVMLDFYMPRGKTVKRLRPSVAPDSDKLMRAVFDSLTDAGVWADDSLVVDAHAREWYAEALPGVRVVVESLA